MGPVFRFGRNPMLRLFLSRKITDVGIRAIARNYRNEPPAGLGHFGTKYRPLSHPASMLRRPSLFQPGSLPQSSSDDPVSPRLGQATLASPALALIGRHMTARKPDPHRSVPQARRSASGSDQFDCCRLPGWNVDYPHCIFLDGQEVPPTPA